MNPIIDRYGNKRWRNEEEYLHREDGPAIELTNGDELWYTNGVLHRDNGPAIIWDDGTKFWYYHGQSIDCSTQEEFEKIIKLRMFW